MVMMGMKKTRTRTIVTYNGKAFTGREVKANIT